MPTEQTSTGTELTDSSMIIAPPDAYPIAPALETPIALANATAAAHEAAAIAADGEFHRASGSVAPASGNWSPVGSESRPPIEPRMPSPPESHRPDGVIDGTVSAEKPPPAPARRSYQRRRRAVLLVFLVLAILVLIAGQLLHRDEDRTSRAPALSLAAASGAEFDGRHPAGSLAG